MYLRESIQRLYKHETDAIDIHNEHVSIVNPKSYIESDHE